MSLLKFTNDFGVMPVHLMALFLAIGRHVRVRFGQTDPNRHVVGYIMLELREEGLFLRRPEILQPSPSSVDRFEEEPDKIEHAVVEPSLDLTGVRAGLEVGQALVVGEEPDLIVSLVEPCVCPERTWFSAL